MVIIDDQSKTEEIGVSARNWVITNKKTIISTFADPAKYLPLENPVAYFMAGSPGAGKTEFSKSFIEDLEKKEPNRKIVRIDADEIRNLIPSYDGKNAHLLQSAASLGVEKIIDSVIEHNQDFLLDGTLAHYDVSLKNITRCLKHKRKVALIYLYQDPIIAWDFTQKREKLEGRRIKKASFIDAFCQARVNIGKLKKEFGSDIQVNLVIKDFKQGIEKTQFNVDNVDNYLKKLYNSEDLDKLINEDEY